MLRGFPVPVLQTMEKTGILRSLPTGRAAWKGALLRRARVAYGAPSMLSSALPKERKALCRATRLNRSE